MNTRERSTDRAAVLRRVAGGLSLPLLVSGAAVGSAHGLAAVSSPDTSSRDASSPVPSSIGPGAVSVAPAVSLSRWEAALALGGRSGIGRPLSAVSPTPTAVPPVALGAYHRAAAVLAEAAPSCELEWNLLAAVGHVESGHGKRPGSALGADGVSRPAIIGPAIDAPVRGDRLPDTDAGELDGRADQDRAVGPMQLLPGVWTAAAVDGDGDGRRDPQDIDDAALAAGVLLCASAPELGSSAGSRQALRQYNATRGYVDLVQRLSAAYALVEATPVTVDVVEGSARPVRLPVRPLPLPVSSATPAELASATEAATRVARPTATAARTVTTDPASGPGPSAPTKALSTSPTPTGTPEPTVDPSPDTTTAAPVSEQPRATTGAPSSEPSAPQQPDGPSVGQSIEPTPTPETTPEPTPRPPDESPEPEAAEPAAVEAAVLTGIWTVKGDGQFLLDGTTVVDLEALGDLSVPAPTDLDGDGLTETVGEELEGLGDSRVEVRGIRDEPDVVALTSLDDLRRVVE